MSECYWDADLLSTRCPKHERPIRECPLMSTTIGGVTMALGVVPPSPQSVVTREASGG